MPPTLSAADVERYARDGFLSPDRALTPAEAAGCRTRLEAFERAIGGPLDPSRDAAAADGRSENGFVSATISATIVRWKREGIPYRQPAEGLT